MAKFIPVDASLVFALTIIVALASPVPNVLIAMIHWLKYRWRRAVWTVVGNISCLSGVTALPAFGIVALICTELLTYGILKTAGAAYLINTGIGIVRVSFGPMGGIAGLDGVPAAGAPPSRTGLPSYRHRILDPGSSCRRHSRSSWTRTLPWFRRSPSCSRPPSRS